MDDLTDDWPLTAGGETTFELIDCYLLVLMKLAVEKPALDDDGVLAKYHFSDFCTV